MRKASVNAAVTAPQFGVASGVASRTDRHATLAAAVEAKVEIIRTLLAAEAIPGSQSEVASRMEWRRERVSREIQGVEKLSVALFLAAIAIHRQEGRGETADRLLSAINEGQPVKLKTNGAVVIRMADGQMFLDLQS